MRARFEAAERDVEHSIDHKPLEANIEMEVRFLKLHRHSTQLSILAFGLTPHPPLSPIHRSSTSSSRSKREHKLQPLKNTTALERT